ncbi:MAG: hypothetical protein KGS48_01400 [Bacteroidetes bacterium]|nr:hypothetical protein [Bacteroidota bacterium]
MTTPLCGSNEIARSIVLVGRYKPSATQTESPFWAIFRALCKSVKACVQDCPVLLPVALARTYRRCADDGSA